MSNCCKKPLKPFRILPDMPPPTSLQETAYVLTKTFMQAILKEYLDENQLSQLMKTVGIQTDEERIFFLTQLTVFLRKYPDSVFATPDVRTHFLATIQEMLDAKILEENT